MRWTVAIREAAEPDIRAALARYEAEAPEQVERFAAELASAVDRIAAYAEVITPFSGATRRMRLRIFPYQVWYPTDQEQRQATIIAIVHDRQELIPFFRRG